MKLSNSQAEYLRKQHVVIGMPMYSGVLHERTFSSLMPFLLDAQRLGMQVSLNTLTQNSIIAKARCVMTADFLAHPGTTHLMWVDSDMVFDPHDIFRLLLHDRDVVAAMSTTKTFPPSYTGDVLPEAVAPGQNGWNVQDGLIPLAHIGTGFTLVKRSVFERMIAAYPETKFHDVASPPERNRYMFELYANGINKHGSYVGEDWMFCDRWRAIGGRLWADPAMVVDHIGSFIYSNDKFRLLTAIGAKSTGNGDMALNLAPSVKVHDGGNDLKPNG